MQSGTFHVLSQDWRYYAREKSLTHTLHLGQLPTGTSGDTVLIDATPPVSGSSVGGAPTLPPINPYGGTNNPVGAVTGTYPCWYYHYETIGLSLHEDYKNVNAIRSQTAGFLTVTAEVGQGGVYQLECRAAWVYNDANHSNFPLETLYSTLTVNGAQLFYMPATPISAIVVTLDNLCNVVTAQIFSLYASWVGGCRLSQGTTVSLITSIPAQAGYFTSMQLSLAKVSE